MIDIFLYSKLYLVYNLLFWWSGRGQNVLLFFHDQLLQLLLACIL